MYDLEIRKSPLKNNSEKVNYGKTMNSFNIYYLSDERVGFLNMYNNVAEMTFQKK